VHRFGQGASHQGRGVPDGRMEHLGRFKEDSEIQVKVKTG
jgi:hypothetical protein